jgi:hypothetical protein
MKRDDRELIDPSGPKRARAQIERVNGFDRTISEDIQHGAFNEDEARRMKRAFDATLKRAEKLERPKYVVRYGLVAGHHGRDWGVGRPANRCLECHLDNVRLYLENRKGVAAIRSARELKAILNKETTGLELIRDLFRDVPRPGREKQAKRFLDLFLNGTTTDLATGLRDQVVENLKNHRDHFKDEDFPPNGGDFDWSLLDSLQDKIIALKNRASNVAAKLGAVG